MSSKNTKHPAPQSPQYAEEVLCANWNPLALLLAEPLARVQNTMLDSGEVEDFLARLYPCQRA